jgi:hypothetical protein
MNKARKTANFSGSKKARNIRRHPIESYREYLNAGVISRIPKLDPEFMVAVSPKQSFIVRHYGRNGRPIEVKCYCHANGSVSVVADRSSEIELMPKFIAKSRVKSKSK